MLNAGVCSMKVRLPYEEYSVLWKFEYDKNSNEMLTKKGSVPPPILNPPFKSEFFKPQLHLNQFLLPGRKSKQPEKFSKL